MNNIFAMKVIADGMKKYRIEAGDNIYIDTTLKPKNGKIVVVQFPNDTGLSLRRMTMDKGYYIFESFGNPELYKETDEDVPNIIGVVTSFSRDI